MRRAFNVDMAILTSEVFSSPSSQNPTGGRHARRNAGSAEFHNAAVEVTHRRFFTFQNLETSKNRTFCGVI